MSYGIFTRKQIWRKCFISLKKKNNETWYESTILSLKKPEKNTKKVRFDNTAYLRLIPTREEMNKISNCYDYKYYIKKL